MGHWLQSVRMLNHGLTVKFCSAKVLSPAIFDTYCSYHKDIWIATADYYMVFYITGLFPLTDILKLINFTVSLVLVY